MYDYVYSIRENLAYVLIEGTISSFWRHFVQNWIETCS